MMIIVPIYSSSLWSRHTFSSYLYRNKSLQIRLFFNL